MELSVYWTQFAEDKLDDIFSYYVYAAGERVAHRLINELVDCSMELEKNPFIGQKETLLSDREQEFRYLVCKNYKLIYWINQDVKRIEILHVFDCRQNPIKLQDF